MEDDDFSDDDEEDDDEQDKDENDEEDSSRGDHLEEEGNEEETEDGDFNYDDEDDDEQDIVYIETHHSRTSSYSNELTYSFLEKETKKHLGTTHTPANATPSLLLP